MNVLKERFGYPQPMWIEQRRSYRISKKVKLPALWAEASLEWILDIQEVKFSKVPIGCIQLPHIVLPQ